MRAIPSSLDPLVVSRIDARLDGVEQAHGVQILWAIESGSRAWGFPSPDSDYDCRFLYARPQADYLSLWPARDVIETPLDAVYDVNGWDVAKALRLLVKGNAVVVEWLRSPIVYRGDASFRDELAALADDIVDRPLVARHYLHVGVRQLGLGSPSLKRFFYALRPAAALRWLREHPDSAVAPMHLPTLLAETTVGADVRDATAELIAVKALTREMGDGAVPGILARFVDDELALATIADAQAETRDPDPARRRADEFFRTLVAG